MVSSSFLVVLALTGSCLAKPQYGDAQVGVPPPEASLPEGGESSFKAEHESALKDFWWQVDGVFEGGEGGSSGVGPGVGGPFTPQQSQFCDAGFDCVPWQSCVDGYVSIHGGSVLDQRTRPANYNDLQCGQEGNMCCGFSSEQLVSTSLLNQCGHSSYECVPHYNCIDGEIVTDGAGLIDIRVRPQGVCTNADYPDVPGVCCLIPGATPTPVPVTTCPGFTECIDYSQCGSDGTIVTDGSGLIDIRTGYTSCYLSSGIGGICCQPPIPQLDNCPAGSVCSLGSDCFGQALDASNNFIDYVTTGLWSHCSYGGAYDGVCCIAPQPPTIDLCPDSSICLLPSACSGTALDGSNNFIDYVTTGLWTHCSYGGAYDGVCCIAPQPQPIDLCPDGSICLLPSACSGTALDGSNNFIDYVSTGTWTHCTEYDQGVCCINPYTEPNLHAASECGVRNYNIDQKISSPHALNEAKFGEFPWQTIIFYQNYTFNCGASLISHKHLLTAAHCVDDMLASDIRIRFGEWQVNSFDEPLPYADRNIAKIWIHEDFNPKNVHNDVAILELIEPIDFQYHINTVCLPEFGQVFDPYSPCIATGWGKDSFEGSFQHILKKIDLPYIDNKTCEDALRKTRLGKYFKLDPSFLCAGGEENKDACYGDGGGPLVCKDAVTQKYVIAGITSWGIGCGTKDVPGVYADIQKFRNWVNDIVLGIGTNQQQSVPGYGK